MFDKNTHPGRDSTAWRPYREDWHSPLMWRQQSEHSTFTQFCCEQPRRSLCDSKMFQYPHTQLLEISATEWSRWCKALKQSPRTKLPWLHGAILNTRNCGDRTQLVD